MESEMRLVFLQEINVENENFYDLNEISKRRFAQHFC